MANTWHGAFPWEYLSSSKALRIPGTTPVRMYPPNNYGLYDVVGNVWEWTSDHYSSRHRDPAPSRCCAPRNPHVGPALDVGGSGRFALRVTKGGSHLCAPNYCLRYRPAARQGQSEDTATCHLGFRCVVRPAVQEKA